MAADAAGVGISVILPAKNESAVVGSVVARIRAVLPAAEILLVDDGSTDDTAAAAASAGARVVSHPVSMGNGAAVKTGARHARHETLVFLDADGQHPPESIPMLLARLDEGYAMVVGARDRKGQANAGRAVANRIYNAFASWIADFRIEDLTSGFRAVRATQFRQFLALLPNHFSYPTTITLAFVRMGYAVAYVPVEVAQRVGKSHISPMKDGMRFLIIISKIAILFSPLKLFFPASLVVALLGIANYAYTYLVEGRFTNMSALMLMVAVILFFFGLLSEQICMQTYIQAAGNDGTRPPPAKD